ncbi:hypothetical protein MTO96_048320 [Rhipicephalus appendiculatus]
MRVYTAATAHAGCAPGTPSRRGKCGAAAAAAWLVVGGRESSRRAPMNGNDYALRRFLLRLLSSLPPSHMECLMNAEPGSKRACVGVQHPLRRACACGCYTLLDRARCQCRPRV